MLSLLELVSQNQPHFQTHQALLVLGLQNDFILPDGKLPVSTSNGFVDRMHALIPTFRQQSSNVIWIRTLYEADRLANDPATGEGDAVVVGGLVDGVESSTDDDDDLPKDLVPQTQSRSSKSKHKQRALDLLKRVSARRRTVPREAESSQSAGDEDEELFLRQSAKAGAACLPNTPGAEFAEVIRPKMDPSDTVVNTTNYSAFQGTSLLLILRARLVTEVYICGCITNVSVLATVIDAARHGIRINVVGDCLGFRKRTRHEIALKRMVDLFDANIVTSAEIIRRNQPDAAGDDGQQPPASHKRGTQDEARLQNMVDRLRLTDANPPRRSGSNDTPRATAESPAPTVNGQPRSISDASAAGSRHTTGTGASDEHFADMLVQGAKVSGSDTNRSAAKPGLVKTKIRMRSRTDKSKKEEKAKAESSKRGESRRAPSPRPAELDQAQDQPVKSPKAPAAADNPHPTSITKAESSDKLRENLSRADRPLKASASQPALSATHLETKDKSSASRVRLALSRSSKSDSNKDMPAQPPVSPAKSAAELPNAAQSIPEKSSKMKGSKLQSLATFPVLGPGDRIAEGDSRIIYDLIPPTLFHPTDPTRPLKDTIFTQLYNEVRWQKMLHQQGEVPRLVCCEGEFGADGSMPVYRHPTDQALPLLHFSPKVQFIRKRAEKIVGHPLNHVLIQLYRSGNDYISEHSDKTLDIVKGSSIVNISFGAQRTMRLRTKKTEKTEDEENGEQHETQRETQRVAMPHNSMFILGLKSNEKWLHGIMADKRLPSERSEAEIAYSGIRISLTFRHIGTFLDARETVIWGQGASCKDQRDAADIINNDEDETERMVRAFSRENHSADFDWNEHYGEGFDVLHLHEPPADLPIFFESCFRAETNMIKILLAEYKVPHILCPAPSLDKKYEVDRAVAYRDNDSNHTMVIHPHVILVYLDRYHSPERDDRGKICTSGSYDLILWISTLLKYWVNRNVPGYQLPATNFVNVLERMEETVSFGPGPFIAGRRFSMGDCAIWPALDELISGWDGWSEEKFPHLTEYYRMLWRKKKGVQALREELPRIKKTSTDIEVDDEEDEDEL